MKIPSRDSLYLLCFVFGAGIGVGCTAKYFKNKYEIMAQTEIESVRKALVDANRNKPPIRINTDGFIDIPERPKSVNNNAVDILGVDIAPEESVSAIPGTRVEKIEYSDEFGDIEIIPPIEFGTNFEYEPISLVWYAGDGALVCDDEEITDDIAYCIGLDALNHFGEYEDDAVHVRNHARKCDYEVLLDERSWSDMKRP